MAKRDDMDKRVIQVKSVKVSESIQKTMANIASTGDIVSAFRKTIGQRKAKK